MRNVVGSIAACGLALLAVPASLGGQGLELGVEAGINVSGLQADSLGETREFDAGTGLRGGAVLRYGFTPALGIQTGASFSRKAAEFDNDLGTMQEIEIEYLEVPLLLQLDVPTGPAPVTPRVFAGGTVNLGLSCHQDAVSTFPGEHGEGDCDAETLGGFAFEPAAADVGLVLGGGVDVPVGPGALTLDARYELGLTDVHGAPEDPTELGHRTLQATAGYVVPVR